MTQQPAGFNPYGAVDLAALAQQRQAAERAAAAAESGSDGTGSVPSVPSVPSAVIDVIDATFDQEVVQRSMTVPVVIDFWAEWCGPCKQLSPILERLAGDDDGRWVLAKVDVDANPQLSAAAQVQSIPTVMVVWQGQVIPGFSGALPEAQVRDFLNQVIALAGEPGDPADDGEPGATDTAAALDPALEAADEALARGDFDAAAAAYEKLLADRPADPDAEQGLARVSWLRRTQGHQLDEAVAAATAKPADVAAQQLAADLELLNGDAKAAFDRLVAVIARSDSEDKVIAKEHLLELFDLVGSDDPFVISARRSLASALF